jgi:uncharacterized membrane protein
LAAARRPRPKIKASGRLTNGHFTVNFTAMLTDNLFILPKAHAATACAAVVASLSYFSYSRVVVIKNGLATFPWLTRGQRERK